MYKVTVIVTLKTGILDPQGKTIRQSFQSLDYDGVVDVKTGKVYTLMLESSEESVVRSMCERVLSNPVMEDYTYTIEEVVPS
ncbi:phosphoribosylformylglycinamidine synthase [Pontibacillus halophilus JSM 076056 = DSM 19796]|uniref:Phosphoribosylformylglycinamidine synthase subunit PurS n=1 Tax=Pontibacillus halophilus JSM 076056 = DSM 19796 TaxID=1385510 RepID=A0A0A5I326_9BACI|nr:phosphoribosylformylglycinamidine synthase subunit PurS [Pontibacillus halophilus]KGX90242.1 phosphoribosylformylglycinamidine synthase [Pontibacillus halophilus JSM 076056 = DSM 19796]